MKSHPSAPVALASLEAIGVSCPLDGRSGSWWNWNNATQLTQVNEIEKSTRAKEREGVQIQRGLDMHLLYGRSRLRVDKSQGDAFVTQPTLARGAGRRQDVLPSVTSCDGNRSPLRNRVTSDPSVGGELLCSAQPFSLGSVNCFLALLQLFILDCDT